MSHSSSPSSPENVVTQVRDRYKKLKEMSPEKREAIHRKWKEYEGLTEEEKKNLRQAHPATRPAPQSGKTLTRD